MGVNVRSFVDPSDISGAFGDLSSCETGITATASGTQVTSYQLTKAINRVTTVASGAGVKLPVAKAGSIVYVTNAGANALAVFPYLSSSVINALSAGAAYSVATAKSVMFVCAVDGQWDTILTA